MDQAYCFPHFTDEETEVQAGYVSLRESYTKWHCWEFNQATWLQTSAVNSNYCVRLRESIGGGEESRVRNNSV